MQLDLPTDFWPTYLPENLTSYVNAPLWISTRMLVQERFYTFMKTIYDDSKAVALCAIAFQRHQIRTPLLVLNAAFNTFPQLCKAHTNKHVSMTLVAEFWGQGSRWSRFLYKSIFFKNVALTWLSLIFRWVIQKLTKFDFQSQFLFSKIA